MNKNDVKLITVVLTVAILGILYMMLTNGHRKEAEVYYEDKLLFKIDLNINRQYIAVGDNGEVVIEVKDKKVRVISENSPLHICSKQGYISNKYESIICLPNKIIIKINAPNKALDAIAK